MITIRIPYHRDTTAARPTRGALKISKILKEEYNLEHSVDFNWSWELGEKNLMVSLNDKHESIATVIGLRFIGMDLYDL